jgi:multidrug efflux system outer membrane protein
MTAPIPRPKGRHHRVLLPVVLAFTTTSCLLGPKYERPRVASPEQFRFVTRAEARSVADLPWWDLFRDPVLNELIAASLEQSFDVRIAAWRVEEARALAGISRWSLYPALDASASASSGLRRFRPGAQAVSGAASSLTAQISWELDVWGRLRREREASFATFEASVELRRGVVSTLVADVAQAYFELRGLDLQRQILESTIKNRKDSVRVYQFRLQGGVGSEIEVSTGEAQLYDAQATLATVEQQIAQQENQLSVLLGRAPGDIRRGLPLMEQPTSPAIPPGMPSTLLERRPDIRAAEQQLIAANANVGVAEANFFPQFSLTSALGLISPQLARLFTGDSATWSVGGTASLLAPILGGHSLIDQKDAAVARFEQAKAAYERTVVVALQEVADALVAEQQLHARIEFLELEVTALTARRELAQARFNGGAATYLEVTTAEEALLPAGLSLEQARIDRSIAIVQLYRALGGGWQAQEKVPASPSDSAHDTSGKGPG